MLCRRDGMMTDFKIKLLRTSLLAFQLVGNKPAKLCPSPFSHSSSIPIASLHVHKHQGFTMTACNYL